MEVIIGMCNRPKLFDVSFGLVVTDELLSHDVGDGEGWRPWNTSVAVNQNSSLFSSILDEIEYLIEKFDNFLTFVIENMIENIVDVLLFFLGEGVLTDRDDSLNFVGFEDMFVDGGVAVSDEEGAELPVVLEDEVGWGVLVVDGLLHRQSITLFEDKLYK